MQGPVTGGGAYSLVPSGVNGGGYAVVASSGAVLDPHHAQQAQHSGYAQVPVDAMAALQQQQQQLAHAQAQAQAQAHAQTAALQGGAPGMYGTPPEFLCAMTRQVMANPVWATDGYTYERAAIEGWMKEHNTSPLTGAPFPSLQLTPNDTLRWQIDNFRSMMLAQQQQQQLQHQQMMMHQQQLQQPQPQHSSVSSQGLPQQQPQMVPNQPQVSQQQPQQSASTALNVAPPPGQLLPSSSQQSFAISSGGSAFAPVSGGTSLASPQGAQTGFVNSSGTGAFSFSTGASAGVTAQVLPAEGEATALKLPQQ